MNVRKIVLGVVLALFWSPSLQAAIAEEEIGISSELLYRVALQYVHEQGARLHLSDESAGIMKFRWRQHEFEEDGAVIEIISRGIDQSKIRVTFPNDYGGRTQIFLKDLLTQCKDIASGKWGKLVRSEALTTYRAALRFVLKNYVPSGSTHEDVVRKAEESAGMIQFVYQEGSFTDSEAKIRVVPVGVSESRVHVLLPADPGRRVLLEQKLIAAIKEDVENEKKDHF